MMKKTLIAFCAVLFALDTWADSWTDPWTKITWTYTLSEGDSFYGSDYYDSHVATITGVSGATGDVTIPGCFEVSTYTEGHYEWVYDDMYGYEYQTWVEGETTTKRYMVQKIGENAFSGCTKMTSVTIPGCLMNIARNAFSGCFSLISFKGEEYSGWGFYRVKDGFIFYMGDTTLYLAPTGLTAARIPAGTTGFDYRPFEYCTKLKSVYIPNSMESVSSWGNGKIPETIYFDAGDGARVKQMFSDAGIAVPCSSFRRDYLSYKMIYDIHGDDEFNWIVDSSVSHNGDISFRSAAIGDSCKTFVSFEADVTQQLSLWWKVSSESHWDVLRCYINGEEYESISGVTDWKELSIPQSYGRCVIKFEYSKDGGGSDGSDCGWVSGLMTDDDSPWNCATLADGALSLKYARYTSGDVVVPYEIDGASVSTLDDWLFECCSELASVSISNGVKKIGKGVFSDCTALESVNLPESMETIGESAFKQCSALTTITVPNSVTNIGSSAFAGCSKLSAARLSEAIDTIRQSTFTGCAALTTVNVSENVATIERNAFLDCTSLATIDIPAAVTSIGEDAFKNTALVNSTTTDGPVVISDCIVGIKGTCPAIVVLPSTVRLIANKVFNGCSTLKTVCTDIGDSERIRALLVASGLSLSNINVIEKSTVTFDSNEGIGDVAALYAAPGLQFGELPYPMREGYVFSGWYSESGDRVLSSSTVPTNTSIRLTASWTELKWLYSINEDDTLTITGCCQSLYGNITIPSMIDGRNVTCIGSRALYCDYGTSGFKVSVYIKEGITNIQSMAFYRACGGCLRSVTLPSSLKVVGSSAFDGCGIETVSISDLKSWYEIDFCDSWANPLSNGAKLIVGGNVLKDVSILEAVGSIPDYAFCGCTSLESVRIDLGVTNVGSYAFCGCSGLSNVSISATVSAIGHNAFKNTPFYANQDDGPFVINRLLIGYCGTCPAEIAIPDGVIEVCPYAFSGENITKVTFPDSLKRIEEGAFYHCCISALKLPSGLKYIGKNAFDGNQYSSSRYYKYGYLRSISIEDAQDLVIDEKAFYGQPVTDVRISGANIAIGASAFASSEYWRAYDTKDWRATVCLTGSGIRIGDKAFYDMSYGYVDLDLSGVISIGEMAFYRLSTYYRTSDTTWYERGRANIKLPNTLESVGDGAFECSCINTIYVDALESFLQEDTLSSLSPMWTFFYGVKVGNGQDWLCDLTVPDGWTKIPTNAFRGTYFQSITIPASVKEIGSCALSYNTFVTNMTFYGDAPILGDGVFAQDARYSREYVVKNWYNTCTVTVMDKAKGWDDDGDGKWQGFNLRYLPSCEVRFVVDEQLLPYMTSGRGQLVQYVEMGGKVRVPRFDFHSSDWSVSWSGDVDAAITGDVEFVARYETAELAGALCLDDTIISSDSAANWVYRFDDNGEYLVSGKLAGAGESWMELAVTNDARIAFDCKASTLRLNNKAINTFKCFTNGVEALALDGNTDWQHSVWEVAAGTVVRWVYSQMATYGSDYENCGWVRNLAVYPKVTVSFESDELTIGKLPSDLCLYTDETAALPGDAGFGYACHTFVGWTDGETTYAPGESYDGTNGSVTLSAVWTANTLTPPNIGAQETYAALSQPVTLTDDNDGATLYYSVNGSPFAAYAGAFDVVGEAMIRAYAAKNNYFNSATSEIAVARQQYAVTFAAGAYGSITDGETVQQIRYGDDATPVEVAADKWHKFTGWDGAVTGITSARNLTAQYTLKTFTLDFGGENITWQYGDALIGPTPTLAKHRLAYWSYQGTNYVAGSVLPFDGENVNYTVVWEEKHLAAPVIEMPDRYDGERCTATVTAQEGASIRCKIGDGAWFDYAGAFDVVGSATVTAYAVQDDWYDSVCAVRATVRGPWTFGEYLGTSNVVFTSSGTGEWLRTNEVGGVAGYYLACGDMENDGTGTLSATFHGKGTIRFRFRASVESWPGVMDFDYFVFADNGDEIAAWSGETGWQEAAFELTSDGDHVVSWSYIKDGGDTFEADFDNCVWLDSVTWTAAGAIPDLGENPTSEQVATALDGSADAKLVACITNAANYNAYREWAETIGAQAVKDSPNAWVSFALGSGKLLENAPTDEDLTVEKFEPSGESGKFDFTVSVEGVEVGSDAQEENLKQVFGLEGATTLDPDEFSSGNVDLTFGTPEDGKVKFTAGPKDGEAKTFFMKVKVKP